ncbi:MAG: VWA domain-containing protein [Oscillospiraceae bacterium]|nr:VWA domain-containing protein [Oscillospiraceae bacterium]
MSSRRPKKRSGIGGFFADIGDWIADLFTPSPYRPPGKSGAEQKLNIVLLVVTLLAGAAAWVTGGVFYANFETEMPRALLIGIIFLVLYLLLLVAVLITGLIRGTFEDGVYFLDSKAKIIAGALVGGLLVFLLAMLFQWLYGLDPPESVTAPTSYVFVIDDSGSMDDSDPEGLRYSSISEVLNGMPKDFPFMVYSFSDGVDITRPMAPVSSGTDVTVNINGGMTNIKSALEQVLADYKNGVWQDAKMPKVILLSDGYATDIDWLLSPIGGLLKEYNGSGISISTVGLGEPDRDLLEQIARDTGGVFIYAEDASKLNEAMRGAVTKQTFRDLLSARAPTSINILHGIMRVLFITLLGSVISLFIGLAYTQEDDLKLILAVGVLKSLLGGLLMEIGTALGLSDKIAWPVLWLLIAATFATIMKKQAPVITRSYREVQHY